MRGEQIPRDGQAINAFPLYEFLSLELGALDLPLADNAQVVMQGWGRLQLGEDEHKDNSGDVNLLYIEAERGRARLRAGRQQLMGGVGRMALVDGGNLRYQSAYGVSAEAFAGTVVQRELRIDAERWLAGGRLGFNLVPLHLALLELGEFGVSYLQEHEQEWLRRHEVGGDALLRVGPTRWALFAAMSVSEKQEVRLKEARVIGSWRVDPSLLLSIDAERATPEAFLSAGSIYTVFTSAGHDAYGAEMALTPSAYWALSYDAHYLMLERDYLGYRTTLRVTTYREASHQSLIGLEARRVVEGERGYVRGRLFSGLQLLQTLRASLDLLGYIFDADINGATASYTGLASIVYDITPSIRLAATIAGGRTPYADAEVRGILRFAYGYAAELDSEATP